MKRVNNILIVFLLDIRVLEIYRRFSGSLWIILVTELPCLFCVFAATTATSIIVVSWITFVLELLLLRVTRRCPRLLLLLSLSYRVIAAVLLRGRQHRSVASTVRVLQHRPLFLLVQTMQAGSVNL